MTFLRAIFGIPFHLLFCPPGDPRGRHWWIHFEGETVSMDYCALGCFGVVKNVVYKDVARAVDGRAN